jgi:hypothetical protein
MCAWECPILIGVYSIMLIPIILRDRYVVFVLLKESVETKKIQ